MVIVDMQTVRLRRRSDPCAALKGGMQVLLEIIADRALCEHGNLYWYYSIEHISYWFELFTTAPMVAELLQ